MSGIIDIAIGMFFVYLLLSVICSGVNEWVGSMTASRSRSLESGIRSLLNDPKGKGLAREVLDHPLIQSLEPPSQYSPAGFLAIWFRQFGRPQYISSGLFTTALLDQVTPLLRGAGPRVFADVQDALHAKLKTLTDKKAEIENSRPQLVSQAAQLADEAKSNRADKAKADEAREAAKKVEAQQRELTEVTGSMEPLNALLAIASNSPDDLDKFRENLENWYDERMDRVSGWFKRKSQFTLTAIAAIVSVSINADGMAFLEYLNQDSTARASIAAAARDFVQNPANDPRNAPQPVVGPPEVQARDAETRIRMLTGQLRSYMLPIGWDMTGFTWDKLWTSFSKEGNPTEAAEAVGADARPMSSDQFVASLRRLPSNRNAWFFKAIGLLFSTLAMSMGASFYFELLKQLVNLRQSGPRPQPNDGGGSGSKSAT